MTYLEKLRELTGREIYISPTDSLYVDGERHWGNCPTSWFKFEDNEDKFCNKKNLYCEEEEEGGLIDCWNREYQGEEYSGRLKIETKEFTVDDIKAGMLVELRSGKLGIVIPNLNNLEIYIQGQNGLKAWIDVDIAFYDNDKDEYGVIKIYDLSSSCNLFNKDRRKLLWERKSKTLTISEAENILSEKLGETVKITS